MTTATEQLHDMGWGRIALLRITDRYADGRGSPEGRLAELLP